MNFNTLLSGVPPLQQESGSGLPILESYMDTYKQGNFELAPDIFSPFSNWKYGGGLIQISWYYPATHAEGDYIILDIQYSHDNGVWFRGASNLKIFANNVYPLLMPVQSNVWGVDINCRFLYWRLSMNNAFTHPPNEIVIVSTIQRTDIGIVS